MFTPEELSIMQSAVETYNDEDRTVLNYDLQSDLAFSCLTKIEHYNSLTYFTKQELTFIAMSIDFVISMMDSMPSMQRDKKLYKSLIALIDRLSALAR